MAETASKMAPTNGSKKAALKKKPGKKRVETSAARKKRSNERVESSVAAKKTTTRWISIHRVFSPSLLDTKFPSFTQGTTQEGTREKPFSRMVHTH